jgi:hypothetical protein
MLHLIYIICFTILALLAIYNLIRNLMTLGMESQRFSVANPQQPSRSSGTRRPFVPHPELFDESGKMVDEPFLVLKSMTVEDARERLDALYESSPGGTSDDSQESV